MILNGPENIFLHLSSSNLYFLVQEIFPAGMCVVLFSRLYMSCAPFLLFRYIWIKDGMIGFTSLCLMLARFRVLAQCCGRLKKILY